MTDVQVRLDEFSRALYERRSRRSLLKLGLGLVGATFAASLPGRAAGAGANMCRDLCLTLPPGPERGECFRQAAQQDPASFCARCGGDATRICGDVSNQVCCDPTTGQNCCALNSTCVTCRTNETFNPATCACECAIPCRNVCCAAGQFCCNESCSICAAIDGGACTQQFCEPLP